MFFGVVAFNPGLKGSWDLFVSELVAVFGDRKHCSRGDVVAFTDGSREEGVASSIDVVGHTEDEGLCFLGCVAEEDGDDGVGERVEVLVVGFDFRFNVAGAGGMDCDCCVRKAGTMGVDYVVQSVFKLFIERHNHS